MLKRDIQGKFALKNDDSTEGSGHSGRVLRVYPSRLRVRNSKKQPFTMYYTEKELKSPNGFHVLHGRGRIL